DIGPTIRANAPIDGMGATLADFDQDGDWDMFQTNNPNGHVLFVWDQTIARFNIPNGNWFFEANLRGVQSAATGWGAGFADYDCDGDDDLLVMMAPSQSHLFRNDPGFSFTDVTLAQAIPTCAPGGYSFAWVDYDDDGDLDLWDSGLITSGQLGQNQASGNNWLKIRLIGTSSNRDALGAMVLARSASRSQRRLVTSGEGYLSDGDKRVHFGLGMDTSVDQLEIRWPSGTIQILESVAANQTLTVTEPRFTGPSAGLTLGTTHPILFDVPDDVGTFYYCGFTLDPFAHTTLADGRIVRLAPLDPAFVYSTTLGNPMLFPFVGVLPSGGVTLQLVLPAGVLPPALTIPIYFLGFTIDAGFPGSIKSIVGPHPFLIS
ncbi:MAG: ASPIC/UnbV domain-containing protein, partial [Planctomycetes bacterium]|nr:ASPIC/UnbV domain-containing protein [Planctomycetota bacterium]